MCWIKVTEIIGLSMILYFYMARSQAMFTAFSGCRCQAKFSYVLIFISFVISGFY